MKKRTVLSLVAVLIAMVFIVSASIVIISTSTEGNGQEKSTKSTISYKPRAPQNEGDPDDMGGGLRNIS